MYISGRGLAPRQRQAQQPLRKQEKQSPKLDEPKVRFLQTWEPSKGGLQSLHRSIHHFCTEPLIPQLPIPLQVASRHAHANPLADIKNYSQENGSTTEKTGAGHENVQDAPSGQICPPPNTPYVATRTTSLTKTQALTKTLIPVEDDAGRASTCRSVCKVDSQSLGGRPSTVGVRSSLQVDDDIVERARSQLEKELRSERKAKHVAKPSTTKLGEVMVKQKAVSSLDGVEGQMTLGGSQMKVARDPSK